MKQYLVLSSLAIMLLSSCGSNSNENGLALGEKKAALEKLKSQKATLDEQIKKMEGEIDLLDSSKAGAQKPKLVSVQTLQLTNFDHFIELQGKIDAENISIITPRGAPGQVKAIFVQKGSYVKKGQLLASIRSTEVAGYEKDLEDAKNDVIVKKNNYKVIQELFEGKLNAERDVVEAKSEYEKALSQLNRVQETYQIYNMNKGAIYEVRAPMNGFIIEKKINQDMLLRNDRTDNIFDIAEINEVWAVANINESDINNIKVGVDAEVTTLSYPNKIFTGKLDKLFNIIDPETKAMKAIIKLNNPGFILKPEMSATIKLSYNESKQMIAIPSNAVIFDKSKNYVMVFKDRTNIETRQVEVFRQVGGIAYITNGLKNGEKIMTNNQLLVYDALND
jgi:cobalt-zinc-cadmium efflux system membrane fusion protein